jgi:hypothetical protein
MSPATPDAGALGERFARAISEKDADALTSVFDPAIDFRGVTPGNGWVATDPAGVAEIVLGSWFEPTDHVREILDIESEPFLDRHHLRYRFRVENDDGMHVVEQQAYFTEVDGRITRMSVMCSGFRPDGEPTTA